jgi:hypothetical protein
MGGALVAMGINMARAGMTSDLTVVIVFIPVVLVSVGVLAWYLRDMKPSRQFAAA